MSALCNKAMFASPLSAVLRWIQDQTRSGALNDLRLCGEKEIERIARDAGLSVSEFRTLECLGGSNAPDLLERRMASLDLDPNEVSSVAPYTFRDLQRVCSLCESHRRCLRDLGRASDSETWKDYCPNVGTLLALDALPWSSRSEW